MVAFGSGIRPLLRHLGGAFGRALHHAQHIVGTRVEHFADLPPRRREHTSIHAQPIRVGLHVVHRTHHGTGRCHTRRSTHQIDPLVVVMLGDHLHRQQRHHIAVECAQIAPLVLRWHGHAQNLLMLLQAVEHAQHGSLGLPIHHGQVFVSHIVPVDHRRLLHRRAVVAQPHGEQIDHGVLGERTRVTVLDAARRRIRRITDRPHRLGRRIEALHQQCARIRPPPEPVVAIHLLARGEFREPRAHRLAILWRYREHRVRHCGLHIHDDHRGSRRVCHALAIRAHPRVQHRAGELVLRGICELRHEMLGTHAGAHLCAHAVISHRVRERVPIDCRHEQLAVHGEGDMIAQTVHRVRNDPSGALPRTFTTRTLGSRHVVAAQCVHELTRVHELHFGIRVFPADCQPQRILGVLLARGP